jgi:hypothetical protein
MAWSSHLPKGTKGGSEMKERRRKRRINLYFGKERRSRKTPVQIDVFKVDEEKETRNYLMHEALEIGRTFREIVSLTMGKEANLENYY